MRVSRKTLKAYTDMVAALSNRALEQLAKALERIDLSDPSSKELVKVAFQEIMPGNMEASAYVAARMYDALREASVGEALGAELYAGYSAKADDIAINGIYKNSKSVEGIEVALIDRVLANVKRAAMDTMVNNAASDRKSKRYTRVTQGAESCGFCLMLSSMGAVHVSHPSPDLRAHVHGNCDCIIVPYFEGQTIDGYSQDEQYAKWQQRLTDEAAEAAERKGTTVAEEKQRILGYYENSAKRAKQRDKQ